MKLKKNLKKNLSSQRFWTLYGPVFQSILERISKNGNQIRDTQSLGFHRLGNFHKYFEENIRLQFVLTK